MIGDNLLNRSLSSFKSCVFNVVVELEGACVLSTSCLSELMTSGSSAFYPLELAQGQQAYY